MNLFTLKTSDVCLLKISEDLLYKVLSLKDKLNLQIFNNHSQEILKKNVMVKSKMNTRKRDVWGIHARVSLHIPHHHRESWG